MSNKEMLKKIIEDENYQIVKANFYFSENSELELVYPSYNVFWNDDDGGFVEMEDSLNRLKLCVDEETLTYDEDRLSFEFKCGGVDVLLMF